MANNTDSNNTYFDIEGLMIDYGITGETIVRKIMSQLDLKCLGVLLRISKTFYRFLDKEQGLWIRHLKGAIKDVKKMRKFLSNEIFEQWLKLAELIESNGNAADVISFIPRFYDSYKHRQDGISFKQVPLEAAINHRAYNYDLHDVTFLKVLKKHDFLHDLENSNNQGDEIFTQSLLNWAVKEKGVEALELVLSIVQDKHSITRYGFVRKLVGNLEKHHHDPIYEAIMEEKWGVAKLKMLIPLVGKKTFWSSGDPHTPLADAIKVGNMEMVKAIIPYTKVDTTSKKFGSYLHVAVKYGRLEIFKHLCQLVENWESLKDKKGRTADQLLLKDGFQFVAYEDYKKKARPTWECDSSDEDELNQDDLLVAMSEMQPAKKKRYNEPWVIELRQYGGNHLPYFDGNFVYYPETPIKKDLKEMKKKRKYEDLYDEFCAYFEEI